MKSINILSLALVLTLISCENMEVSTDKIAKVNQSNKDKET